MTRNLDHRVEAVAPIEDPALRRQPKFNLELIVTDNCKVREMDADGDYAQRSPDGEDRINAQEVPMRAARRAAEGDETRGGIAPDVAVDGDLLVA